MKVYNSITGTHLEVSDKSEAKRMLASTTPWSKKMPDSNQKVGVNYGKNNHFAGAKELTVDLTNCYGIPNLQYTFTFAPGKGSTYSIYAPNGIMKTSFSKTFEDLSKGRLPKEERYNRSTICTVKVNGYPLAQEAIYVLKSELDISVDSPSITNILVDPKKKERYDQLLIDLDKLKIKLIRELATSSGLKQVEIEKTILQDFDCKNESFSTCMQIILNMVVEEDLSYYSYDTIFDSKALTVLKSKEFLKKSQKFQYVYQELFEQKGSIYKKGIFNPSRADTSFKALTKHGFFEGGHRVHLRGDDNSINKNELDEKLKDIHANIDGDADLKKIKDSLAKSVQTEALARLIETLSAPQLENLLKSLKSENQSQFRKQLWGSYIQNSISARFYVNTYEQSKDEIEKIEGEATQFAPRWEKAVELFNNRFVDLPFELTITNQKEAVLGRQAAALNFIFKDDPERLPRTRDTIRTSLSQGERRALYLLNFVFDVEERKMNSQETLFILDDVADSFDYKNKHAIIQYLRDLTEIAVFSQIVLTHNFDFFRALSQGNGGFINRSNCLMTSKSVKEISLSTADGISNYFVKKWKPKVMDSKRILYATIPFTRNLIEYTQDYKNDPPSKKCYLTLTSLLHWKQETEQITVGDYLLIYNSVFKTSHSVESEEKLINILYAEAKSICNQTTHTGLDLEDKVLLSIAIRLASEKFLINELRRKKNDNNYWCESPSQFRNLFEEYKLLVNETKEIRILEKVGITVNSNIHLNSFMYEPILDLTIDHLVDLYTEVKALNV